MRWRARLLTSPVYLLLSAAAAPASARVMKLRGGGGPARLQQSIRQAGSGGADGRDWLRLLQRRLVVACRLRNLARILGAALVAVLLILILTKGYSLRRKGACRCTRFTYSQCQPWDGACGPGTKRAFCQQKRCQPRRKLLRCALPCEASAAAHDSAAPGCSYTVRRQSRWTKCSPGVSQRSRVLFLQAGSPAPGNCPATRTERRRCKSRPRSRGKDCIYEPHGTWSACNRERNEIVNTRRLTDGTVNNCPGDLQTALRCLKRDGSLKCIYSRWTKWTTCEGGARYRTRVVVQGEDCLEVTRMVQNCLQQQQQQQQQQSDTILRK